MSLPYNPVTLSYEYDWDSDPEYLRIVSGEGYPHVAMDEYHVEYSKAIHVEGSQRYRSAFNRFSDTGGPGTLVSIPERRAVAERLWRDEGCRVLSEYMDRVRKNLHRESVTLSPYLQSVSSFLPQYSFHEDPVYAVLIRSLDDSHIAIAKGVALSGSVSEGVIHAYPSTSRGSRFHSVKVREFERHKRSQVLLHYLETLHRLYSSDEESSLITVSEIIMKLQGIFRETSDPSSLNTLTKSLLPLISAASEEKSLSDWVPPGFEIPEILSEEID